MKTARLEFAISYLHWTPEDWTKVSFTNKSTVRLVRVGTKFIRRGQGDRYDTKFCRKTVKHSARVDFLRPGTMMNSARYLQAPEK